MTILYGDLVKVSGVFTVDGTATDPTKVTLRLKDPAGVNITATYPTAAGETAITRDATGVYHYDVDITGITGTYYFRFEGSGSAQAAEESYFTVASGHFF